MYDPRLEGIKFFEKLISSTLRPIFFIRPCSHLVLEAPPEVCALTVATTWYSVLSLTSLVTVLLALVCHRILSFETLLTSSPLISNL